jgi:hypothetical protein
MSANRRTEKEWPAHYNPKPGELNAAWPTVRTETLVELVLGAIKRGAETEREIKKATNLKDHQLSNALAELILWRKQITCTVDETADVRRYFPV